MKVMVISFVIGVLRMISIGLVKELEELNIGEWAETLQYC